MDRVRNEEVHIRAGIGRELASREDQRVWRWFGHVERMDESPLALIRLAPLNYSGVQCGALHCAMK